VHKIAVSEVKPLSEYEAVREDFRRHIIELKRRRRVQVGPLLSFTFENRDTVLFQIQEMLRAENVSDPQQVQEEVSIYNTMLPGDNELSATLFIEVTEQDRLPQELARLRGLDQAVTLRIGESHTIPAVFEAGRAKEEALSTVQYLRFRLTPEQVADFQSGRQPVSLVVDHPNYREAAPLSEETRRALAADFTG
jgi:hypothetical protein